MSNKNNKNKLKIKDNRHKRNGQLCVVPTPSSRTPQKSLLLDDKNIDINTVKSMRGKKSYSEIAKIQGLYICITAGIRKFRQENRDSTFADLYVYLQDNFPTVFQNMSSNASNVAKIISADPQWSQAYFCNLSLIELAEQRMSEVLTDETIDNSTKINAYDKVWKYEIAKRQMEKNTEKTEEDNNLSIKFTFGDE